MSSDIEPVVLITPLLLTENRPQKRRQQSFKTVGKQAELTPDEFALQPIKADNKDDTF